MVTNSVYLALGEKDMEDCVRLGIKQSGSNCGQKIITNVSMVMQSEITSSECAVTSTKKI